MAAYRLHQISVAFRSSGSEAAPACMATGFRWMWSRAIAALAVGQLSSIGFDHNEYPPRTEAFRAALARKTCCGPALRTKRVAPPGSRILNAAIFRRANRTFIGGRRST